MGYSLDSIYCNTLTLEVAVGDSDLVVALENTYMNLKYSQSCVQY